ncbi:hypothetical protein SAMN04487991_1743 [Celeribacter neptunius]|uniref:Uncharacterized protein n=1 Tax=Celeribacter neptunius TaxID=588602 RepID=A0A1I3PNK7_9RHOB|nr:hypothetical protein SAMN04487991_1743 [Celeribacter neptunius]
MQGGAGRRPCHAGEEGHVPSVLWGRVHRSAVTPARGREAASLHDFDANRKVSVLEQG